MITSSKCRPRNSAGRLRVTIYRTRSVQPRLQQNLTDTGAPVLAGPIATAGGLVFLAGTTDSRLRAFDSQGGKELWSGVLDGPGNAVPVTYMGRDGKQYVVIATGTGGKLRSVGPAPHDGASLIAFRTALSSFRPNLRNWWSSTGWGEARLRLNLAATRESRWGRAPESDTLPKTVSLDYFRLSAKARRGRPSTGEMSA
jgi:outer membrane protein assembly factor BamB